MARRYLSTAALIKSPPLLPQRLAAALTGQPIKAYLPTEAEVRDALARAIRDLEDMRVARASGWEPVDEPRFGVSRDGEGGIWLRASLTIERRDDV